MQLSGNLTAFPLSNLFQWAATEKASGILNISAGPGYRLRFEKGRLVAASCWSPAYQLDALLLHRRLLSEFTLDEMKAKAASANVPLAQILAEANAIPGFAEHLKTFAEEIVYALIREKQGTFFVDAAADELADSLKIPLDANSSLFEGMRRLDEENRLFHLLPSPDGLIELVQFPSNPAASGDKILPRVLLLVDQKPRTLQYLIDNIPADPSLLKLRIAEMLRDKILKAQPAPSQGPDQKPSGNQPIPILDGEHLQLKRLPSPEEQIFLTAGEANLLLTADATKTFQELVQGLGSPEPEILLMAQSLLALGLIEKLELPAPLSVETAPVAMPEDSAPAPVFVPVETAPVAMPEDSAPVSAPPVFVAPEPVLPESKPAAARLRTADVVLAPAHGFERPIPPKPGSKIPLMVGLALLLALIVAGATLAPRFLAGPEPAPTAQPELIETPTAAPETPTAVPETPTPKPQIAEQPQPTTTQETSALPELAPSETPVETPSAVPTVKHRPGAPTRVPPTSTSTPTATPTEPPPCNLIINALPWGNVKLQGVDKGVTPLNTTVPCGIYDIEISRKGYKTERRKETLNPAQKNIITFTLKPGDS